MDDDTGYFYENHLPEQNELVMVKVKSIDNMGVLCSLLEYNNIEGFMQLSELSRKRLHSIGRLIKVSQQQVLQVVQVDTEKKYIDLSKRFLSVDDITQGNEKYFRSKTVYSISKYVAKVTNKPLNSILETYIYPLYNNDSYDHPFEAFKQVALNNTDIWNDCNNVSKDIIDVFIKNIKHRINNNNDKKKDIYFNITCFTEEGIDSIKHALENGLDIANNSIKIQLIKPPQYLCSLTSNHTDNNNDDIMNKVLNTIRTKITELGGNFEIVKN